MEVTLARRKKVVSIVGRRPSPRVALQRIQSVWREEGASWEPSRRYLAGLGGIDDRDLDRVIRFGRVTAIERGTEAQWQCRIEGLSRDGEPLGFVVELRTRLYVLQVF